MKDKRPVFLPVNPFKFPLPFVAFASILHRISGIALLFAVGYFLYLLQLALSSPAGFEQAHNALAQPIHQLAMFVSLAALAYHFILGVKHLLLDFHLFDTTKGSQLATTISFCLFAILLILIAVWIWT
ncbi:MAG: succinate dehydrogenase, cytochrome b556 subunit [bacterium]